jgi:hypothetical protein
MDTSCEERKRKEKEKQRKMVSVAPNQKALDRSVLNDV